MFEVLELESVCSSTPCKPLSLCLQPSKWLFVPQEPLAANSFSTMDGASESCSPNPRARILAALVRYRQPQLLWADVSNGHVRSRRQHLQHPAPPSALAFFALPFFTVLHDFYFKNFGSVVCAKPVPWDEVSIVYTYVWLQASMIWYSK